MLRNEILVNIEGTPIDQAYRIAVPEIFWLVLKDIKPLFGVMDLLLRNRIGE
jgi:hypothetical protein